MTNKGPEMTMKDDQDRCRSLVCDPNGIIVAEMVYRCMICFYVTDTMVEAKEHYTLKHMDDEEDKDLHENQETFPESDVNNLSMVASLSAPYYKYPNDEAFSPEDIDNFEQYSPLVTMTEGEAANVNVNGGVTGGKSGYVNCAVCGVTRFYSCVQRRYGQFTCVTCYRYFRTFLLKPKKYSCPNLGECLLNVRTRCRACWLKACIDVFSVDLRRQHVIDDFRPVRKLPSKQTSSSLNPTPILDSNNDDNNIAIVGNDTIRQSNGSQSNEISTITVSFNSGNELPSILEKNEATLRAKSDKSSTPKPVKVTVGKKVWSCGKCATCLAEDCGKCIYCLDRPKFGGPFIKKQRCIKRRCLMKIKNKTNGSATC